MPQQRRSAHPLADPSGLHVPGRFLSDVSRDRVFFLPNEEAYYRAWCEHFGIDFAAASETLTEWHKTFDELRCRYYDAHPEIVIAMEQEYADLSPRERAMMIAVRTQDPRREEDFFRQMQEEPGNPTAGAR